jgi:hypothetical protein
MHGSSVEPARGPLRFDSRARPVRCPLIASLQEVR